MQHWVPEYTPVSPHRCSYLPLGPLQEIKWTSWLYLPLGGSQDAKYTISIAYLFTCRVTEAAPDGDIGYSSQVWVPHAAVCVLSSAWLAPSPALWLPNLRAGVFLAALWPAVCAGGWKEALAIARAVDSCRAWVSRSRLCAGGSTHLICVSFWSETAPAKILSSVVWKGEHWMGHRQSRFTRVGQIKVADSTPKSKGSELSN